MSPPSTEPSQAKKMRARLRHAAFTAPPAWINRNRPPHARPQPGLTRVDHELALPSLPEPLDGLRICHLSDLHVGELLTPAHLPAIVDACMSLDADLIAVTGDFVDLSLRVLDDVIEALLQLEAPHGVYLVLGNHDYLDDGEKLVRRFRDANLGLLRNETLSVEHDGACMRVYGIDFAHQPQHLARLVRQIVPPRHKAKDNEMRLLLAHHPHAFDFAHQRGVHVTLSGHTHGGQFVLSNGMGRKGSIGLGSMGFRYPRGLYRRGESYLYVNSGAGSWFPWRFNCPAELACLTLRAEPTPDAGMSHP